MGDLNTDDRRISEEAVVFAKANRKEIARRLTDPAVYAPDNYPVSIFMAGSPGAGKTETSIEFMNRFESSTVRIDPDLLRAEIPSYTGANATFINMPFQCWSINFTTSTEAKAVIPSGRDVSEFRYCCAKHP